MNIKNIKTTTISFDSEKCLHKFKDNNFQKIFKCSFVIQNKQDPPLPHMNPIFDTKYWSTTPHEGVYFNDFIFFGIRHEVLNRVIVNGLSGSAWYFNRFVSFSLKVFDQNFEFQF